MQENIKAIEKEKQEYLEEHSEKTNEEINVDETEFSLTESEINEWIIKLIKLKEQKNPIELEIDEENILKINFDEDKKNG